MSDSEVEFESADEGSKDEDGWGIETDFDLPDVEPVSAKCKPTETNLSTLSSVSDEVDTGQNAKCKHEDTKHSRQNDKSDAVSMVQSELDKLVLNSDNSTKSGPPVSEAIQNEIKQTSTQPSVSKYFYDRMKNHYLF